FHPWWSEESSSGHLALSWTAPLAQCGNYSCMDGVVGADTTLDLVSYELRLAWLRLQWNLRGPPWGYELASENSSIFIVKQVSPLYPSQEGLLVGASHFTEALIPGRLLHAVNSPSSIVAITAQAVLQRYGAWNSTELTRRDKDRSFHFSLRDAREGRWRECHPLAQTDATAEDPDHDWESNCYQATTHTIYLDDTLQWLVVVSTPAAAFSKFHVDKAIQVELEVKREHHEAEGKQWDTLIESAFLGVLASAVVVIMGLVTSCWVLRPLRGLSKLMRRLTQLDFAHDSEEYRKLQDGEPSHIWEVDSLKDGFWRLSRSIEVFARFVPDSVVRRLITGDDKASRLHVLRKNVSIMFSDVRDFTSISEELKQDDLIMLLTVYLTGMTRVIESYQGVVGEILGDGILAFWNTPDDVAQHAAKACSAALAQQQALIQLNEEFKKMGLPSLSIRIGIHTGVGILCSEVTRSQLPQVCYRLLPMYFAQCLKEDGFVCRKLDMVQVKGKKEPTIIYEASFIAKVPVKQCKSEARSMDPKTLRTDETIRVMMFEPWMLSSRPRFASADLLAFQPIPPTRIEQAQLYEQALQAYTQQQFSEATQLAAQLLEAITQLGNQGSCATFQFSSGSVSNQVTAAGGPEDAELHQKRASSIITIINILIIIIIISILNVILIFIFVFVFLCIVNFLLIILFSQSYVDTSARENYRCDREIMYMLDMLMRPYPRRQILVTDDVKLAREANTVCHVRSAKWLNEELLKSGPAGVNASEALMSIEYDFQPIMEELPKAVQIAFAAR
ncbi:cya1, partial [Symbiodinium microadriaticum]